MSNKTKKNSNQFEQLATTARQTGLILMTMAATLGLVEVPEHFEKRAVLATQPVFAYAGEYQTAEGGNVQRREREESGPHYVSYSVAQRTPGRTGKLD